MSYYDDEMYHAFGRERANHKYLDRVWKNGHWNYVYNSTKGKTNLRGQYTLTKQSAQRKLAELKKARDDRHTAANRAKYSPTTANSRTNLRGKYTLAKQGVQRKVDAFNKARDEKHTAANRAKYSPTTANSRTNLRGRYTLAKQGVQRAMAPIKKARDERHAVANRAKYDPTVANSRTNLKGHIAVLKSKGKKKQAAVASKLKFDNTKARFDYRQAQKRANKAAATKKAGQIRGYEKAKANAASAYAKSAQVNSYKKQIERNKLKSVPNYMDRVINKQHGSRKHVINSGNETIVAPNGTFKPGPSTGTNYSDYKYIQDQRRKKRKQAAQSVYR